MEKTKIESFFMPLFKHYLYPWVIANKNGYTVEAVNPGIGAEKRRDTIFVAVLMGCSDIWMKWTES
jgi:hypothetical protein